MSGLDIEAIRARFAKVEAIAKEESPSEYRLVAVHAHSAMDVPKLLAELDRLAAELLEEQTVHAKTFDNFEAHSEACLEERTRHLDRYARLEARLHASTKHLTEELTASRSALADALAVIASMSGEATT